MRFIDLDRIKIQTLNSLVKTLYSHCLHVYKNGQYPLGLCFRNKSKNNKQHSIYIKVLHTSTNLKPFIN